MTIKRAIEILETYRGDKFLGRTGETFKFDELTCKNTWELKFYAGNIAFNEGLAA